MIDFFIILHARSTSKKIKLAKFSIGFTRLDVILKKQIKNLQQISFIDFATFLGFGVFFF